MPVRESKGFVKKKIKKESLSKLKEQVWKWFSIYIRLREADWRGYAKCVTCGAVKYWKLGDAGHFVPGRSNAILFEDRGVHFQCKRCNGPLKGNPRKYEAFMKQRYGQAVINELDGLSLTIRIFSPQELKDLLHLYKSKANQLLKKHG